MPNPVPAPRRKRRWWKVLLGLAALALGAAAALPWWLSSAWGTRWLLARANRALAPGRLEVRRFSFSWFGPTRMAGFVIRDPQGDPVVAAPVAVWDRTLGQALFDRPRLGTLRLEAAALDVERRPDGSIDLVEALRSILNGRPEMDWTIRINDGSVRVRGAGLAEPIAARQLDLTILRPPAPAAIAWRAKLAEARPGDSSALELSGLFDRWTTRRDGSHDLVIDADARHWPLALQFGGVTASAVLDGQSHNRRHNGRWLHRGRAVVLDPTATGPTLAGDRLRTGRVAAAWEVEHGAGSWRIGGLDVASPLVSIKATVPGEGRPSRVVGSVDLAALASQLPHALRLRPGLTVEKGSVRVEVAGPSSGDRPAWDASARVADLVARDGEKRVTLRSAATLSARVVRGAGGYELDRFGIESAFLNATGSGRLSSGATLSGSLDLDALRRQLDEFLDLGGVPLSGRGPIRAEYRAKGREYEGRATLDLSGVRAGPLRREAVALTAEVRGPADEGALPAGVTRSAVRFVSGEWRGGVEYASAESPALTAEATGPVVVAGARGRFRGRARAQGDDAGLVVRDLAIDLVPDRDPDHGAVRLALAGRYDRARGELDLRCPDGGDGLRIRGLSPGAAPSLEGRFSGDLAAAARVVAAWTGAEAADVAGAWATQFAVRGGETPRFSGRVDVGGLSWPGGEARRELGGSIRLDVSGTVPGGGRVELAELVFASPYATLDAAGTIDLARPAADLSGTIAPAWDRLNATLAERVEPGATVRGRARAFRLRGPLDDLAAIDLEAGVDLEGADVYGLVVGPTPIVVRRAGGRWAIDPIRTTLNGGTMTLRPELVEADGRPVLKLAAGSSITGAEVNDEVSHRVLAFVAPVLERASRVRGTVSAVVRRAEVPLGAGAGQRAVVEGEVVFRDVAFAPGPLAADLLDLVGRRDATLRLDQPVVLAIADGRIHQRGLALPLAGLSRIELEGTVGFDRSLDMTASLPLTPAMVANNPLLGDVVSGARLSVPIGGTLARPRVDRGAFQAALADLGKDLLRRGAARGAAELLMRLARPRPPAPDRPSPEERRTQRRAKQAERRRAREAGPPG